MNAWIFLIVAILFEVSASSTMKFVAVSGNKALILLFIVLMSSSFAFLYMALKNIDLSVAYAIWSGAGIILTACVGFAIFGESAHFLKLLFLCVIFVGVVGLKLVA